MAGLKAAITRIRNALRLREASAPLSMGVLPVFLAHGVGTGRYDELIIFGGMGLIIAGLAFLSWRAGRKRKRSQSSRRRKSQP